MEAKKEWYMEYEIARNRPGLLGDVSSILGMLNINIVTINGVDTMRRGMLLLTDDDEKMEVLRNVVKIMDNITITRLRPPTMLDRLAVRHGRYIERDSEDKKTFRFVREELGLLVDFMAEIFKKDGHQLIGIRGMPRVGKTESMIAASVSANKRWTFISSTLLRQTVRSSLAIDEMSTDHVYLIDGIVSTLRSTEKHFTLLREIMNFPAAKIIEHPDIFVRESEYQLDDFHYIIELRHHPDEEITYELINNRGFDNFEMN
ncbi:YmfK family protein [Brevibacillus brevis]|uniref:YmfK family protein n=1 Tax=Brevibacillus brevis TaxID=1393 RepID=UPI00165E762F|nr:YmfK family protein [Brevibacillus brevis]